MENTAPPFGVSKNVIVGDGNGTVGSASLVLELVNEIPDDATVSVRNDGIFDLSGHNETIGLLNLGSVLGGGQVATGAGTLTLNGDAIVNGSPTASTITGNLALSSASHTFNVADGFGASTVGADGERG